MSRTSLEMPISENFLKFQNFFEFSFFFPHHIRFSLDYLHIQGPLSFLCFKFKLLEKKKQAEKHT